MNASRSQRFQVAATLSVALLTLVFSSSLRAQKKGEPVAAVLTSE